MKKTMLIPLGGLLAVLLILGCAPSTYKVTGPTPSQYAFEQVADAADLSLTINDARKEEEKTFSLGILKAGLLLDNKPLDPIAYLKEQTVKELNARGVSTDAKDSGGLEVNINKMMMRNHRANGYAPFVTFTMLSADVMTPTGAQRIGVYIKRGKVPVWSFDEIIEPTFNEPLSLVVKEFSAKINALTANQSISNEQVNKLVADIKAAKDDGAIYRKVYQLGFGNNKSAIVPLVEFSKSTDEYVRIAAISSLGILKAEDQLEHLKSISKNAKLWQDRGMALKAICDIGNEAALDFARKTQAEYQAMKKKDKEAEWTLEILGLYL